MQDPSTPKPLNPTTLAREFDLPWRPGTGAERLTWEQFYEVLESKYWAERVKRTAPRLRESA